MKDVMKVVKYLVVKSSDPVDLGMKVDEYLLEGWELHGQLVFCGDIHYAQAVILRGKEGEEVNKTLYPKYRGY